LPPATHNRVASQHSEPVNKKLWFMLTQQAKSKFQKYPSPAASTWVHKQYVQMGGRFRDTRIESASGGKADPKKNKKGHEK
jgi:hypothetical protein